MLHLNTALRLGQLLIDLRDHVADRQRAAGPRRYLAANTGFPSQTGAFESRVSALPSHHRSNAVHLKIGGVLVFIRTVAKVLGVLRHNGFGHLDSMRCWLWLAGS